MSEEKPRTNGVAGGIKESVLKILLGGTGGGAGVAIVYFAYDLLRSSPQLFGKLLEAWGPGFVYVMAFLWIGHGYVKQQSRFAEQHLTVSRESATASARLAGAVESLAARDDTFQRAQEALLGRVARNIETLLDESHDLRQRFDEHLEKSVKRGGEYEHRLEKVEGRVFGEAQPTGG